MNAKQRAALYRWAAELLDEEHRLAVAAGRANVPDAHPIEFACTALERVVPGGSYELREELYRVFGPSIDSVIFSYEFPARRDSHFIALSVSQPRRVLALLFMAAMAA